LPGAALQQRGVAERPARRAPILQLHPTLRCNLRCRHCYSVSGPERGEELDLALLVRAMADARALGFEVVSVSGGEPFLYRPLGRLLATAKALGLRTTVTSNGTAITARRLAAVAEHLDGIALSLDGRPERHNEIRASRTAFERLVAGIEQIRGSGVPFGIIHTLTEDGWPELPWVAEFAAERGASLLQIHPLEPAGRAPAELADYVPGRGTNERICLLTKAIEAHYDDRFAVQLDLLLRRDILALPELVHAGLDDAELDADGPGLDSLVIEEDATVVPVSYGFARPYAVGNLRRQTLQEAFLTWRQERWPDFQRLCRVLFEQVRSGDDRLVNWHE
jgi:Fe-coproporphyrin III synthase